MSAMSNKDIDRKNKEETLWQWAERFADLRAEQREIDKQIDENQKLQQKLRLEKQVLQARIDAIRKKRNGIVDELVNNKEEKPHRSEVEEDPVLQAKRQEEFSN